MPSWKKLAVSGSSPIFNHITASGNISSSGNLETSGYIDITGASSDPGADGIVRLGEENNALRIYTNYGYTQIGPTNSGWAHFYTDRANFYFNQPIVVDDGHISSYDEDLVLRRDYNDTSYNQITLADGRMSMSLDGTDVLDIDASGNITASGNISSSEWVYADRFLASGQVRVGDVTALTYSDPELRLGYHTDLPIQIGKTITSRTNFAGHITASGDISSSGTIYGEDATIDGTIAATNGNIISSKVGGLISGSSTSTGSFGRIETAGKVSIGDDLLIEETGYKTWLRNNSTEGFQIGSGSLQAANVLMQFHQGGNIRVGPGTSLVPTSKFEVVGDINARGNISASGHITASGNISSSATSTGSFGYLLVDGGTPITQIIVGDGLDAANVLGPTTSISLDLTEVISSDSANRFLTTDGDGTLTAEQGFTLDGNFAFNADEADIDFKVGTEIGQAFHIDGETGKIGIYNEAPTKTLTVAGDISASGALMGVTNITASGNVDIDGTVQIDGNTTFGVNGTGVDVTFYGDTTNRRMAWDQSEDQLKFYDNAQLAFGTCVSEAAHDAQIVFDGSDLLIQTRVMSGASDSDIILSPQISKAVVVSGSGDTKLSVEGNITASGNISSSGGVLFSSASIKTGLDKLVAYDTSTGQFHITASSGFHAAGGGGGGDIDVSGTPANNQLAIWTDADTLEGDAELTYDGSTLTVQGSISASGDFMQYGPGVGSYISASQGTMELSGSGTARLEIAGDITSSGYISTLSHITASGNISSSAIITDKLNVNPKNTTSPEMSFGSWNIGYGTAAELSGSLSSYGNGYGEIVHFGNGAVTAGRVYCLKSDFTWELADAKGPVSSSLLAISMGTHASASGMLLRGVVRANAHDTLEVGQKVYNEAAGRVARNAGADSGDVVRVLGYCVGLGSHIYFNPDNTWVEHS